MNARSADKPRCNASGRLRPARVDSNAVVALRRGLAEKDQAELVARARQHRVPKARRQPPDIGASKTAQRETVFVKDVFGKLPAVRKIKVEVHAVIGDARKNVQQITGARRTEGYDDIGLPARRDRDDVVLASTLASASNVSKLHLMILPSAAQE